MFLTTSVFLFNLLCAIVPCDPNFGSPRIQDTSRGQRSPLEGERRSVKRSDNYENSLEINPPEPIVFSESGALRGYFMKVINGREIYAFEGIPYAEPPTGNLRFRAPLPIRPWSGLRSAHRYGNSCTQIHLAKLGRVVGHEDCLYLNIYTPRITPGANLTTLFFIHGGGFIFGAGHEYGPSYLLSLQDVILVTINYRLGPLGFLSTGDHENPGNWGLKDQALALKWVYDNIENFGGNKNKITIMGQSAGGVASHLHLMSNMTQHMINNAICMSSSAFVHWATFTSGQAKKWSEKFGKIMRCPTKSGSKVLMDCLRSRDPNFIVAKQMDFFDFLALPPVALRPVIEPDLPGAFITDLPEKIYEREEVPQVPILFTTTKEEAEFFILILKGVGIYRLLLNHWMVAAPTIYDYRRVAKNVTEITHKILDFYLNGTDPRLAREEVFSDIGTDRYFSLGIRKALRAHYKIAPTYASIFGFRSRLGMASAFWGQPHAQYGVPHGEDLTYIFNSTLFFPPVNTKDSTFSVTKLLVSLFSSFAKLGEPIYTDDEGKEFKIWDRIDDEENLQFLQIDNEVKMIHDPFTKRVKFWEDLNINERFLYNQV